MSASRTADRLRSMRRLLPSLVALAALAWPMGSVRAQTRAPAAAVPFTLADALRAARARSPALQAASGRVRAAQGTARQDGAFINPTLEWRREDAPSAPDANTYATATLPIDVTGRRVARREAGDHLVARTLADSLAVALAVDVETVRAYWRAVLARTVRDAAQEQQAALTSLAAFDSTRWREGAVAEGIAMRTRLEADRARLTVAATEADAARAHAELARVIGEEPARLPWPSDPLDCDVAGSIELVAQSESRLAEALERRPELAAARAHVAEMRSRVSAERRGTLGALSVTGGTRSTLGARSLVLGIAAPMPFLDRNRGNVERASGEVMVAEAMLREAETRVRAEVTASARALAALVAARPAHAEPSLAARADAVVGVARAAYREGGTSLLELLEAQRTALDVRVAEARWMTDVLVARAELSRAMGLMITVTP